MSKVITLQLEVRVAGRDGSVDPVKWIKEMMYIAQDTMGEDQQIEEIEILSGKEIINPS